MKAKRLEFFAGSMAGEAGINPEKYYAFCNDTFLVFNSCCRQVLISPALHF